MEEIISKRIEIGIGKLTAMILITWLTPLVGLGNLILLWADPYYKKRAIIALGVSIGSALGGTILVRLMGTAESLYPLALLVTIGLRVWITVDAVHAHTVYKAHSWW
ncbi:MAG: hypothetical protein ACYSRP_08710 [Planctomycetota bacterium]|jgi:4-hydroxybenzoate polyprenyltransferase